MSESQKAQLELVKNMPDHHSLEDKLSKFVRFAETVEPAAVESAAVEKITKLAQSLVAEISDALKAQDKRIAELEALATTDELTQILNRRGFEQQLEHELSIARRHGVGGVMIFVDLDEFKPINDTYGHAAGDEVLKAASTILQAQIRDTDYVGRLGGDEFAILLPRSNKRNGVRRAEELDKKLNNAYASWNDMQIPIKASCGIHMYTSRAEIGELLASADKAMYKIKMERKAKKGIIPRT
ncbi:MAG: GGDEF domain-containing protein [Rhodospirillaceae bacterium]